MDTLILKGLPVSLNIKKKLSKKINELKEKDIIPFLAVILVGNNPASEIYVKSKQNTFIKNNCKSKIFNFKKDILEVDLIKFIKELNNNKNIHGILIQLPLPKHLNEQSILKKVSPNKDVDGFNPFNLGYLLGGAPKFIPCTPYGCLKILEYYNIDVQSKHVVIIGRSNIVGKPLMALLSQKFDIGNATVTICHTGTKNITYFSKQADILIVAIGKANYLTKDMVKKGVHIIDVGINRIKDNSQKGYSIVGDVDYINMLGKAQSITPVPGGVGPMTVTMLLYNTVQAARESLK